MSMMGGSGPGMSSKEDLDQQPDDVRVALIVDNLTLLLLYRV